MRKQDLMIWENLSLLRWQKTKKKKKKKIALGKSCPRENKYSEDVSIQPFYDLRRLRR